MENTNYVVYVHTDSNNVVRYVGHGTLQRAYDINNTKSRGIGYVNFVKENGKLNVTIIADSLTKKEAIIKECELYDELAIAGNLLNNSKPNKGFKEINGEIFNYIKYDTNSPSFIVWSKNSVRGSTYKEGDQAGTKTVRGHYHVKIMKICYKVHRIIFAMFNKDMDISNLVIDHIDGNPSNNSIENLRAITQAQNVRNKKFNLSLTDIPVGIVWNARYRTFVASYSDPRSKSNLHVNKRITKSFPISDFILQSNPKEAALVAAIKFRQEAIDNLNSEYNLGYTHQHGDLHQI